MSKPIWEGEIDGTPLRLYELGANAFWFERKSARGGWTRPDVNPSEHLLGQIIRSMVAERIARECANDECRMDHLRDAQFCLGHTCSDEDCWNGRETGQRFCAEHATRKP